MGGIFVSYRREDTAGYARSLSESLGARFGEETIFRDVDTLGPGVDFPEAIADAVRRCDVLIALIGDKWLTVEKEGRRRLDNSRDYVRLEIAAALDRRILVIPVLVEQARMPAPEELPEALAELADRNAVRLTDDAWRDGVNRLMRAVEARVTPKARADEPAVAPAPASTPPPTPPVPPAWTPRPAPASPLYTAPDPSGSRVGGRTALIAGGLVVALLAITFVAVLALRGGNDTDGGGGTDSTLVRATTGSAPQTTVGRVTTSPSVTVGQPLPGETDVTVAPTSGPVGTTVTMSGSGFQPGERIDISFSTERVAQARADTKGAFVGVTFKVPSTPFKIQFDVVATGATSIKSAFAPFRVT